MNGVLVCVLPYKIITVVVVHHFITNKLLVQVTGLEESRDAFQHFSKVDNGKLNISRFHYSRQGWSISMVGGMTHVWLLSRASWNAMYGRK